MSRPPPPNYLIQLKIPPRWTGTTIAFQILAEINESFIPGIVSGALEALQTLYGALSLVTNLTSTLLIMYQLWRVIITVVEYGLAN